MDGDIISYDHKVLTLVIFGLIQNRWIGGHMGQSFNVQKPISNLGSTNRIGFTESFGKVSMSRVSPSVSLVETVNIMVLSATFWQQGNRRPWPERVRPQLEEMLSWKWKRSRWFLQEVGWLPWVRLQLVVVNVVGMESRTKSAKHVRGLRAIWAVEKVQKSMSSPQSNQCTLLMSSTGLPMTWSLSHIVLKVWAYSTTG